jgi:hypothetical protein
MSGSDDQKVDRTFERVAYELYSRLVAYFFVHPRLGGAEEEECEGLQKC